MSLYIPTTKKDFVMYTFGTFVTDRPASTSGECSNRITCTNRDPRRSNTTGHYDITHSLDNDK